MASTCWNLGRIEAAVGYSYAAELVMRSGRHEVPYGLDAALGGVYM
jgi:hypothetical protein